jgi:hypothetical protein
LYAAQAILKIDPREIGSAFHPDGIRTSKTLHWAGRVGAETCPPPPRLRKKAISELETK